MYKGQVHISSKFDDLPLQGIPSSWEVLQPPIPSMLKHTRLNVFICHSGGSKDCLLLTEKNKEPVDTGIVTRVQPRTSKGITDLLLLSVSYDL